MNIITKYQTKSYHRWVNTKQYIVLHHTWGGTTDGNINRLCNSGKASCHYIVWDNGDIYQIADDDRITRHAGISSWMWLSNVNMYSIWIEIVSDGQTFTDVQRSSVRDLVSFLIKKYNLTPDKIIRHKDIAPKRKTDVGDTFWSNTYKTWEEYQKSYTTKKEREEYIHQCIESNSNEWKKTTNSEYKDFLHQINNTLRSFLSK